MHNSFHAVPIGISLLLSVTINATGQNSQVTPQERSPYSVEETSNRLKPKLSSLDSVLQLTDSNSDWDFSAIKISAPLIQLGEPDYQPLAGVLNKNNYRINKEITEVPATIQLINGESFTRNGAYSLTEAGSGSLKIAGNTYLHVTRKTLEENYVLNNPIHERELKQHIITNSWFLPGLETPVIQLIQLTRSIGNLYETKTILIKSSGIKQSGTRDNYTETVTDFDFSINPNPAFNSTIINYTLNTTSNTKLSIQSIDGKYTEMISNSRQVPGNYATSVTTEQLASGMYFIVLELNGYTKVKKLLINK